MSLSIDSLEIEGFRGYRRLVLEGLPALTVLSGPNAVGKTNIVEAIELLTSGESFRKPTWSETVSWGLDHARLSAAFSDERRRVDHRLLIRGNERVYEVNGKRRPVSAVRGTCPCVLFIPDDLQMVKASSGRRREAADSLGAQLSKNYGALKAEYQQTLRQRNLLIRDELDAGPLFESWNESLAASGARLCVSRMRLFARLAAHMERIYGQLVSGERLDVRYLPSWERFDATGRQLGDIASLSDCPEVGEVGADEARALVGSALERLHEVERRRKTTLAGPHKDEFAFFIDGRNARLFASQGQQRTVVLVWKLAEVELVSEMLQQKPVLLLDDVMSELDGRHREALTDFIGRSAQAFITTTNLGYFSKGLLAAANVVELPIPGTRLKG